MVLLVCKTWELLLQFILKLEFICHGIMSLGDFIISYFFSCIWKDGISVFYRDDLFLQLSDYINPDKSAALSISSFVLEKQEFIN